MKQLKISGHYDEDTEEIIRRMKNILGINYMGFSLGPKGKTTEVRFYLDRIKTEKEMQTLVKTTEQVILQSFAPVNKIKITIIES